MNYSLIHYDKVHKFKIINKLQVIPYRHFLKLALKNVQERWEEKEETRGGRPLN